MSQLTATVRPPAGRAFAFHLYAAGEPIEKVHYGRSPLRVFHVAGRGTGPFYVRAFVKDDQGERIAMVSERLRLR
ncbi:hypothetical protein [Intrasporangium calvum]|uniref:Uncharacterized protein n=1 Tax=Intrasporangium calvum (strain ATCC 23552 / DSM 43043 / JCM 3097 / NBRC 12989 / NCIMB 10167 / NRRL B-3866 / 7 KIP) TaxID=710696 RepID=E6SEQ7_INTC7|nr:hypothetical protein [Intrasporangium calvum]ADU47664.1 hypothetical protein Intca_1145 [Intrasporangium calvum DSM 43043]